MRETFVVPNFDGLLEHVDISEKIVIVSIIGKSSLNTHGLKVKSIGRMFSSNKNRNKFGTIEGYLDEETQVLYLHLYSLMDTEAFMNYYRSLNDDTVDFLSAYNKVKTSYARFLQYLFYISHVVVLSHPSSSFDINYIQIFKAVDSQRQKQSSVVSDLLRSVGGLSTEWINSGRPCTPRIVFFFERCPKETLDNIKKMEHELEDRIYHILRKLRIVSSTNCSSLFAIPANQEYVYMNGTPVQQDNLGQAVSDLIASCQPGHCMTLEAPFCNQPSDERSFLRFLQVHIRQARTKGFDDNISKQAPAHFELPSLDQWARVAQELYRLVIEEPGDEDLGSLCTETRFSEQRCLKVLPLALARYQEGLPGHYTRAEHETRLQMAEAVFHAQARGPLFEHFKAQLVDDCTAIWASRRLCEAPSLTGNPCTLPRGHKDSVDHCSGVRYVSSCDCGRTQAQRDDPYNPRQANCTFYEILAKECICGSLDRHYFPVFTPSVTEYKAAEVGKVTGVVCGVGGGGDEGHSEEQMPLSEVSESAGDSSEGVRGTSGAVSGAPTSAALRDFEKGELIRQASTTEYLPGMLTLTSPVGLLPQFCSWSLVCIGASSLYSHNVGLLETHHPGFLSSTNYLLPWDVTVTSTSGRPWPATSRGHRVTSYNVKVFIGTEYECPRGHRFMMSGPDRVLRATSGQVVKEQGAKLVRQDMPLYFPCPCRPSKPFTGQLMRLHVVTPKAPVQVMIEPRVQPGASAPIFVPSLDGPVTLSQSAYWVVRLPYVYATDTQTFLVAAHSQDPQARLLQKAWSVRSLNPTPT